MTRFRPLRWFLFAGLAVGPGACSDDGLTPTQDAEDMAQGTSGGSATGSVNTSATVTASTTNAGAASDTQGPPDNGSGGESTGLDPGADEGTTSGIETGESVDTDEPPGGSTGADEPPPCVETDDCVCDPGEVICEAVPPACPAGTVPEVDLGTMCWTSACVPADRCQTVPDCMSCGMDLACVVLSDSGGLSYACEPLPPGCMDVPSCDCMPDACPMLYECVGMPPKAGADLGCLCEAC